MASFASADFVIEFTGFTAAGGYFAQTTTCGSVTGILTSVVGDFVLDEEGISFTYANDLAIMFADTDWTDLHVQIGGFSTFDGLTVFQGDVTGKWTWPDGESSDAGTVGGGTVTFDEGIDMTGYEVWLGNGFDGGNNAGVWSGSITLVGVDEDLSCLTAPKTPPSPPSPPPSPLPELSCAAPADYFGLNLMLPSWLAIYLNGSPALTFMCVLSSEGPLAYCI